ncbi:MAG TPA: DUF4919 domain-containing protein [Rhizomicrobium sp.]|nr:DUF4919 domain-containing protein [Rhizomicrobium sp.]
MQFHRVLRAAACAVVLAGAADADPVPAAAPAVSYEAWIAKAEAGDPGADFTALRRAYVLSDGYDPYNRSSETPFMDAWKAFQAKDCATALSKSDEALKIDYTIMALHFVRSDCFKQAGDAARSAREAAIGKGLMESVLASGDGKSVKTAYVVVTMGEERMLLDYLDMPEEEQSLLGDDGHMLDAITGVNRKTGQKQTAFFNVDGPFFGLAKKFGNK